MLSMALLAWLLHEVIIVERPIEDVGVAAGLMLAVVALLVAVRWIERGSDRPERPRWPDDGA
jgi:hypothetical protein